MNNPFLQNQQCNVWRERERQYWLVCNRLDLPCHLQRMLFRLDHIGSCHHKKWLCCLHRSFTPSPIHPATRPTDQNLWWVLVCYTNKLEEIQRKKEKKRGREGRETNTRRASKKGDVAVANSMSIAWQTAAAATKTQETTISSCKCYDYES